MTIASTGSNRVCGRTMLCYAKNPAAINVGSPDYGVGTCRPYYMRVEGDRCISDAECGSGTVCVSSAGFGQCSKAETGYRGQKCQQSAECGRGMQCGCPSDARGGVARCFESGGYKSKPTTISRFNDYYFNIYKCLDDSQCALTNINPGSCGRERCLSQINAMPYWLRPQDLGFDGAYSCGHYNARETEGFSYPAAAGVSVAPSFAIVALALLALLRF